MSQISFSTQKFYANLIQRRLVSVIPKATGGIRVFFHSSSQQWDVKCEAMIIDVNFKFDGSDRLHGKFGREVEFELKIAVKI
jgi:hypothetical protein